MYSHQDLAYKGWEESANSFLKELRVGCGASETSDILEALFLCLMLAGKSDMLQYLHVYVHVHPLFGNSIERQSILGAGEGWKIAVITTLRSINPYTYNVVSHDSFTHIYNVVLFYTCMQCVTIIISRMNTSSFASRTTRKARD